MNPDVSPYEAPPEYEYPEDDDDEDVDYTLDKEDADNAILDDIGLRSYDTVEKTLNQEIMTPEKQKIYLNKVISDAIKKRQQLNGYKADVTKTFNSGEISESEKQLKNTRIENTRAALNDYIKYHENKLKTMKGSGIRRKQRGGNVIFQRSERTFKKIGIDYW